MEALSLSWTLFSTPDGNDDSIFVRSWFVMIRLLQDDDEEIRGLASATASRTFGQKPLNVPHALELMFKHLASFAVTSTSRSALVFHELIGRLTVLVRSGEGSLEQLLAQERNPSVKLFNREEFNFYREPTVETKMLTSCLSSILAHPGTVDSYADY